MTNVKYSPLSTSESKPPSSSNRSKFFFVLLCFAIPVSIIYANSLQRTPQFDEIMIQEVLEAAAEDPNFADRYSNKKIITNEKVIENNDEVIENNNNAIEKNDKLIEKNDKVIEKNYKFIENNDKVIENNDKVIESNDKDKTSELKYILLWTPKNAPPFDYLGAGRQSFIRNKCKFINCYVTANRKLFGGDLTKFDAIAFNGRNMRYTKQSELPLPSERSPHQKYIFINLESSTYQPVCNPWYDGFFNWTSSYKLDSDIMYSYIYIRDKAGEPIGPRTHMQWITDMEEVDEQFKEKLKSKTKAAAWFVSHCITRSKREKYVKELQEALKPYDLTVDVYGRCGPLVCNGIDAKKCNAMVATDYYFYLSFENAFAEDYVTEKLLTALQNDAVPIVYGGSNYSRFLPPGSYLNARDQDPETLASIMTDIIANPPKYHQFFRWRNHYSYSESERVEDVCNVCAALNDKDKMRPSTYEKFRSWWNPDWEERCQDENWST